MAEVLLAIGLCLLTFGVAGIAGLVCEWIAVLLIYLNLWSENIRKRKEN